MRKFFLRRLRLIRSDNVHNSVSKVQVSEPGVQSKTAQDILLLDLSGHQRVRVVCRSAQVSGAADGRPRRYRPSFIQHLPHARLGWSSSAYMYSCFAQISYGMSVEIRYFNFNLCSGSEHHCERRGDLRRRHEPSSENVLRTTQLGQRVRKDCSRPYRVRFNAIYTLALLHF